MDHKNRDSKQKKLTFFKKWQVFVDFDSDFVIGTSIILINFSI